MLVIRVNDVIRDKIVTPDSPHFGQQSVLADCQGPPPEQFFFAFCKLVTISHVIIM